MANKPYQPIQEGDFRLFMEDTLGFQQVRLEGTEELVWSRNVTNTKYAIRVYSSIVRGVSKGVNEEAIRICLVDLATERLIRKPLRVYRTASAKGHVRRRIGELWRWAVAEEPPAKRSVVRHARTAQAS